MFVLLFVVCGASIAAEEPCEPAKPQVQFKISDEAPDLESGIEEDLGMTRPTHVAYFGLKNVSGRELDNPWTSIIHFPRGHGMMGNKHFLRITFKSEGVSAKPSEFTIQFNRHNRPTYTNKM